MPREFTAILIMGVLFHHGYAKMALEELHNINSQMNAYPEGAVVIAGDYKSQT